MKNVCTQSCTVINALRNRCFLFLLSEIDLFEADRSTFFQIPAFCKIKVQEVHIYPG